MTEHTPRIAPPPVYDTVLNALGNTPLVHLKRVTRGVSATMLAKLEFMNPGGSVKDRIGITIVEAAERSGDLKPGGTIVEATSGNTGVGLAIVAAIKGYKCVFVMPDKMSDEKIHLLRAFGARVVITPTAVEPDDPRSYYSVSQQIVDTTPNSILANQYHNPTNPETHYLTTGPEIWQQTGGKIDVFVAGMGTGGTISGVGRYLKEQNPEVEIVGVDPVGSLLHHYYQTGQLAEAHTYAVEGIGEDFLPSTLDFSVIDATVQVSDRESFLMARRLVREEGLFSGGSSGTAVAGALHYALEHELGADKTMVVLLPDSGSRYLSKVFDDDWLRENGFLSGQWSGQVVSDLMAVKAAQEVYAVSPTDRIADVIGLMKKHDISQVPVLENGDLTGIVSEIDLLNHVVQAGSGYQPDATIASIVNTQFATVRLDTPLESLLNQFAAGYDVIVVQAASDTPSQHVEGILTKIDVLDYITSRAT